MSRLSYVVAPVRFRFPGGVLAIRMHTAEAVRRGMRRGRLGAFLRALVGLKPALLQNRVHRAHAYPGCLRYLLAALPLPVLLDDHRLLRRVPSCVPAVFKIPLVFVKALCYTVLDIFSPLPGILSAVCACSAGGFLHLCVVAHFFSSVFFYSRSTGVLSLAYRSVFPSCILMYIRAGYFSL